MLHVALFLLLATTSSHCTLTADEHAALLAQDWQAFDQSPEGFRRLVSTERYCPQLAGEIIEDYLSAHPDLSVKQRYVSEFHAGQQFAGANDIPRALVHFYRGFNPHEDPSTDNRWNAYVRATIAFLEKDRPTLEASASVLVAHANNHMNAINLRLVHGMLKAFNGSYEDAVKAALDDDE